MVMPAVSWLQTLVDGSAPFAGLMFEGVPGAMPVYNFDAAYSAIPVDERPTLLVDYHTSEVVPEPATLVLLTTGLANDPSPADASRSSPVGELACSQHTRQARPIFAPEMRVLADAALSPLTVDSLMQLGHQAVDVRTLGVLSPASSATPA
jgi:hypothetical protein